MRKALGVLAILAIVLVSGISLAVFNGCAGKDTVKNLICEPPAGVKTLVDTFLAVVVGHVSGDTAAEKAIETAQEIQKTGCATAIAVAQFIDYLNSDAFKAQAAKLAQGKLKTARFDTKPLQDWLVKAGYR